MPTRASRRAIHSFSAHYNLTGHPYPDLKPCCAHSVYTSSTLYSDAIECTVAVRCTEYGVRSTSTSARVRILVPCTHIQYYCTTVHHCGGAGTIRVVRPKEHEYSYLLQVPRTGRYSTVLTSSSTVRRTEWRNFRRTELPPSSPSFAIGQSWPVSSSTSSTTRSWSPTRYSWMCEHVRLLPLSSYGLPLFSRHRFSLRRVHFPPFNHAKL